MLKKFFRIVKIGHLKYFLTSKIIPTFDIAIFGGDM